MVTHPTNSEPYAVQTASQCEPEVKGTRETSAVIDPMVQSIELL